MTKTPDEIERDARKLYTYAKSLGLTTHAGMGWFEYKRRDGEWSIQVPALPESEKRKWRMLAAVLSETEIADVDKGQ